MVSPLAKAESTVRFDRIRQIVVMVIVFPAAYYLMGKAPERSVPGTVIMVLGLMLVAVTIKIVGLINKNTKVILRAIADINRSENSVGEAGHGTDQRESKVLVNGISSIPGCD